MSTAEDRWPGGTGHDERTAGTARPARSRSSDDVVTAWSIKLPGAVGPLRFDPADPERHTELLYDWLRQPHVAPWWGAERDVEQTRAYVERQRGSGHLVPWVVSAPDATPFGYVETYRAADDPLARYYPLGPGDRGWHVLVGRPDFIGNGLPRLMGRAVLAFLLTDPDVARVVCEPNELNARMLGYCRALGYTTLAALDLPDKRALLLSCDRATFAASWPGDLEPQRIGTFASAQSSAIWWPSTGPPARLSGSTAPQPETGLTYPLSLLEAGSTALGASGNDERGPAAAPRAQAQSGDVVGPQADQFAPDQPVGEPGRPAVSVTSAATRGDPELPTNVARPTGRRGARSWGRV